MCHLWLMYISMGFFWNLIVEVPLRSVCPKSTNTQFAQQFDLDPKVTIICKRNIFFLHLSSFSFHNVLFYFVSKMCLNYHAPYVQSVLYKLSQNRLCHWSGTECNGKIASRNCINSYSFLETPTVVLSWWRMLRQLSCLSLCSWRLHHHKHTWLWTQCTKYPFMLIMWKLLLPKID